MTTQLFDVSREEVGIPPGPPDWGGPSNIVLHHGGKESVDLPASEWWLIYWKWHATTENGGHGWTDIGYHYGVGDGKVFEGRYGGDLAVGGHTYGFNWWTVAVCVIGDKTYKRVVGVNWGALVNLLAGICIRWNIDPRGMSYINGHLVHNIAGHRDYHIVGPPEHNKTSCPGDAFYKQMHDLRVAVDERKRELERSG